MTIEDKKPLKVLSLKEYKERKGVTTYSRVSGSPTSKAVVDPYVQMIQAELTHRDNLIKQIYTDYNKQIDELTRRQDSLLEIIKQIIKTIEK